MNFVFLGKEIELLDDFLYDVQRDYWLYSDGGKNILTFGLTPSGILKEGGFRSVEFTVSPGDSVQAGDTIAVAVTGKIKYLEAPVAGSITEVNLALEKSTDFINETPYAYWWLARITPADPVAGGNIKNLACYLDVLCETDQRSAHGAKGGGSPTCRSVYEAIQKQKSGESGDC